MAAKTIVFFCAQAILIQAAFGQVFAGNSVIDNNIYVGGANGLANSGLGFGNSGLNLVNSGLGLANFGYGFGLSNSGIGLGLGNTGLISSGVTGFGSGISVGSSGPLMVTTISPIGPSGLAVASENAIQGVLGVSGTLPFLSAVAFDGALPTAGSGVATCGCGNGNVGIVSEGLGPALGYGGLGLGIGNGLGFGIGNGIGGLYY